MSRSSKIKIKGFTLLESVVALVILSTSSVAMYSWLITSLDGLRRVDDIVAFKQISDNLDAYFRSLSIPSETDQSLMLNGYKVDWSARLVEPKQVGRHSSGAVSAYEIGLYQVDVRVSNSDRQIGSYRTRVVSYRLSDVAVQRQQ